jgi:hypothetical protein
MTVADEAHTINQPPTSAARKMIAVGIVLFLLSQILLPLSYYFRNEPTSERFSWRMFSSIDLSTWDTKVIVLVEQSGKLMEREVPMHAVLQETYVKTVQRAQFDIVEPYMRTLAEQEGVREVRFEAQGKFPSGKLMEPIRLSLKPGGRLEKLSN